MLPQLQMAHVSIVQRRMSSACMCKEGSFKVHFMCIYMKTRVSFPGLSGIVAGVYFLSMCFSVF